MRQQRIKAGCFDHLPEMYRRAKLMIADGEASDVVFEFNGVDVRVTPWDTAESIDRQYKRKLYGGPSYE